MRRRRRSTRYASRIRDLLPLVPALLVALAAIWLTVAVSWVNIIRHSRPDLALRAIPFDAQAMAFAAEKQIARSQANGPRDLPPEAERLAREALSRDPTLVVAWRTLALFAAARRDSATAIRLFQIAQRISRRDVPTQLWLIEESVRRNDIPSTLRHYDIALRTSPESFDLLLPILVSATRSQGVTEPLARLLHSDPPWRRDFFVRMAQQPPPGDAVVRLLQRLRQYGPIADRDMVAQLVGASVVAREYGPAMELYRLISPRPADRLLLIRNGGFERDNEIPPLDWKLEQRGDLGATQQERTPGGGHVLQVFALNGAAGLVASQLTLLGPGNYALATRSGAIEGAQPAQLVWNVSCAGGQVVLLAATARLGGPTGQANQADFVVPPNCPAQSLTLSVGLSDGPDGVRAWVDDVEVRRR